MKVDFTYKSGRTRAMPEAQARILQKLGHGAYLRRDMVPVVPAVLALSPIVASVQVVERAPVVAIGEAARPEGDSAVAESGAPEIRQKRKYTRRASE